MQAIILAAGKGVRMLPLTETTPKPLLKINGKPILEHTVLSLPDGIDEILVVVGYLKEQIIEFLSQRFPDKKFNFVEDNELRGTGFAVKACQKFIRGKFLVLNGDDLYSKTDLDKFIASDMAMLCRYLPKADEYKRVGRIIVDGFGNFKKISLDNQEGWVYTGACMLNERFFETPLVALQSGEFGLPQTILAMVQEGQAVKIVGADFWVPIGFPDDLKKAETLLN